MNITKEDIERFNVLMARYLELDKFYTFTFATWGFTLHGKFNKETYQDFIDDGFNLEPFKCETDYTIVKLVKNEVTVVFDVKGTLEEIVELKKEMGWSTVN